MPVAVQGTYEDGVVRLAEIPQGLSEGPVLVIFPQGEVASPQPRLMERGKYAGARLSTEEDFALAEWRENGRSDAD